MTTIEEQKSDVNLAREIGQTAFFDGKSIDYKLNSKAMELIGKYKTDDNKYRSVMIAIVYAYTNGWTTGYTQTNRIMRDRAVNN